MNRRSMVIGALAVTASTLPARASGQTSTPQTCVCPKLEEREGVIVFEGAGKRLTEGFQLDEGRYRVEMKFTYPDGAEHVGAKLHLPVRSYERPYSDYRGETFASALAVIPETGECFVEVDTSTTEWNIGISPV